MGVKLLIGPYQFETANFSVQESATPLAAGDTSGSVGDFTFSLPMPDPNNPSARKSPLSTFGPAALHGLPVELSHTRSGFTLGRITSSDLVKGSGILNYTVTSRLGELNLNNVQSPPIVGTLGYAFEMYLSLAGITEDFFVDPSIALRPVVIPGWEGELWYHLKQFVAAQDCDISLVSGIITLRPIRSRIATRGRDVDRSITVGGGALAQFIEVYQYNNKPITDKLVYPPGGWTEEVPVIEVNAGEYLEEIVELSASVRSIVQPAFKTSVKRLDDQESVFTVSGDDGWPITQSAWNAGGGWLKVVINADTTSLTVQIQAPRGLVNDTGEEIQSYGIGLSADDSTGRYSTLRILGSGVSFLKELRRVPTGVSEQLSASEVGITIDNPFLGSSVEVHRTAARAAREYNGMGMKLSGTVVAINRRGERGTVTSLSYQDYRQEVGTGNTYEQVRVLNSGKSYAGVINDFNEEVEKQFENQLFGNVNGARVWDNSSKRWFRIRSATVTPANITVEAEDDLNYGDMNPVFNGKSYGQINTQYGALTYMQVTLMGVRDV